MSSVWSASVGWGVLSRHAGLVRLSRKDPEKVFPPDLVMVLTTPPVNLPYSAEIPPVITVVSWMASSMNRLWGCPRRFSFTTTPLTRYTLSYDGAPEIDTPATPCAETPGAMRTAWLMVRPVGS